MDSRRKNSPELALIFENIGDADLPYLMYDGSDSVVVLVHATGFLPWLWHPVARDLTPQHTVIAPYIGDYRKADPERGGLPWATIARDIVIFCKKKKIIKPFLVGHSMGATVLTIAHTHYGLEAQGIILIEPIFLPEEFYSIPFTVQDHPLAVKALKRTNRWKNTIEAMEYLKSRTLFKNWDREVLELYLRYGMKPSIGGGLQLVCSPHTEASLFMGGVHFNPWPFLSKVICPVLLIEGEESDSKLYTNIERAHTMFANASLVVVRNAGHLIPMERPQALSSLIRDFIHSLPT